VPGSTFHPQPEPASNKNIIQRNRPVTCARAFMDVLPSVPTTLDAAMAGAGEIHHAECVPSTMMMDPACAGHGRRRGRAGAAAAALPNPHSLGQRHQELESQMMLYSRYDLAAAALGAASLLLTGAGCASDGVSAPEHMLLHGTAQSLTNADGDAPLRVAARWSTERTDHPGVYIQIDEVSGSGATAGVFDLQILAPPPDVLDHEDEGDYDYTSAELVLLDDDSLTEGWVDAHLLNDSEVGRSNYIVYFVASDIPSSAEGHFGIGPVNAGFHLLERLPDESVLDDQGRVTGGIAVWEEVPLETTIEIELGSDGNPTSNDR
jgi:hypothetical protein